MNFTISALQEQRQLRTPGVSATDTSSKDLEIEREESRKTKQNKTGVQGSWSVWACMNFLGIRYNPL